MTDMQDVLEGPLPARVAKVLDAAAEQGWNENPVVSLVVRLTKEDALPFFASWHMSTSKEGKRSWRFAGAYASNGQPLNYGDIFRYLEDPSVIFPEPPKEEEAERPGLKQDSW